MQAAIEKAQHRGLTRIEHQNIVPHPRTLRKAREQIKQLVTSGTSSQRIRRYLHRWTTWWVKASETWHYQRNVSGKMRQMLC